MKKALLIISHGSRREASNKETAVLADRIREQSNDLTVAYAFLEMAKPTIQQAVTRLAESGITDIQVFPHFLAAGTHVTDDIPTEIETARKMHPDIQFRILPHLGSIEELSGLILKNIASETEHCRPESG